MIDFVLLLKIMVRELLKNKFLGFLLKLLYGSKFHKLSQSRGQQGIGISASVMYGQLTTGRASKVISKTSPECSCSSNLN
jgi:DNA topoisomerase VI subunit B